MYGVYLSYWFVAAFFLALFIVLSSLRVSRGCYWIALIAYTLLLVGSAVAATFPMFFNIGMANALNHGSVSSVAYVGPVLIVVFAAVTPLSLYPFVSPGAGRLIAILFFGTALVVDTLYTLYRLCTLAAYRMLTEGGPFIGLLILFILLLWVRVYGLRGATSGPNQTLQPTHVNKETWQTSSRLVSSLFHD
jgi:hypothetical protein